MPLVVLATPANVHDSQLAIGLLAAMPRIPDRRGRPREKPDVALRSSLRIPQNLVAYRARGILALLGQIGRGLGTLHWVVESCLAWFGHFRRLKLCYEKTGEHFEALHDLGAALICARKLQWVN